MSKIKGFYSAVDKAAHALTRAKGTGKEFMVEVAKTKGVKPTEIKERKLQSIADLPKMSKEEFIKELEKSPPPTLKETVIGEPTDNEVRDLAEQFMHEDAVEEVGMTSRNRHELEDEVDSVFEDKMDNEMDRYMSLARQYIMDQGEGTKYPDYKTEGGQNYREILMRLPSDTAKNQERLYELEAKQRRAYPTPEEAQELSQLRESIKNAPQDYRSKHWDEPNVLAHMRVQDRVGPNGEKILHVEEIQSDWHQEGREKGYENPEVEARRKELEKLAWPYMEANKPIPAQLKAEIDALPPIMEKGVPDAPFKKNWHELAMKRLLNYASENGYDKIAITPGAEQAKRYNLSKQIENVIYDEMGNLRAIDKDGRIVIAEPVAPEKLSEYVGKELADKILFNRENRMKAKDVYRQALKSDAPNEVVDPLYKEYLSHPIEYSGLDLETGGEGMKGFYDKMIPSYLNEFGKKYGVQVNPLDLQTEAERLVPQVHAPGIDYRPEPLKIPAETMQFHGFDITPQMREEINTQGLPMFADGGVVRAAVGGEYNTDPDMQDGGNVIQGTVFKRGGRVNVSKNPDTMLLDLISKN